MTTTLLLVHGAWHGPWAWEPLIKELSSVDDLAIETVALPSSGTDPDALGDLFADAKVIADALAAIEGRKVVLAHSYGGTPTTQAITSDTGVAHVVYLAAFMPAPGESLWSLAGEQAPPWWEVHDKHVSVIGAKDVFYNDVEEDLATASAARVGLQSRSCKVQQVTNAGWEVVPTTYIVCDGDQALPPFVQEIMAQRADTVVHLHTGHSPFLSRPAVLAEILLPILGGS